MRLCTAVVFALCACALGAGGQEKKDKEELTKLLGEIKSLMQDRKYAKVIPLAKKAAELDPTNPGPPFAAANAHAELRQHAEAVKAWSQFIKLVPEEAKAYDARGDAQLKQGNFKEALADFDEYLKHNPKAAPDHWRRGIALYYAGRFKDGAAQFDAAEGKAREDVENSVWHYLCNARANTPKKARAELIPVTKDARVPMKQVLELFAGKIKPKDVLAAAEDAQLDGEGLKEARFYANLYVALYYETEGDAKKCLEHMATAVEKYEIGHYMWDVAAVHLKLLKGKK
ncbi:Lipoprotein NlpI precursor [Gemmata obscuriglobus]|uniref:Uncharacterized protein n=1 Tax=Gemmata obscuriglobus TaxID=114 RepID=A0A2Z3H6K0_9BACT|nr:tetratricopeptide repeat protein [Gemmata obscuriglobus]AWM41388.1 hypothetical protein C1280_33225 [Gemmata obscuriglobus]QEG32718.1 Lipoprotein NlpI precursor [Gemmata obscuriglobus]VTS12076.1 tetratricopeptide tpr_1 repeat-containing protein : Tetratricopeptide domain protein OS=Pirellula staleyi (strain ATCC 27377 / DSM 6068 / ICPB 4128) GN=Psta_3954 PE=4 SV=1: TPR_11 [Gemmata obscuriglobus UQM 2246]